MTGIYALQFDSGTGGTTGHDDFGQKGYDIFANFLSSDVALTVSTYGWYRTNIKEYQSTQDFTYTNNYKVWRYYYRIIRSANTVINALGGNQAVPDLDANKYIMGQAKAIRGHSYFYLAQYFQKEYNPSEEILPATIAETLVRPEAGDMVVIVGALNDWVVKVWVFPYVVPPTFIE